jgi:micrococcal nuclease
MQRKQWTLGMVAGLLVTGLMLLGAECGIPGIPGLPGSKPKGMKVTKVKSLDSIIVKTKEDSGLTLAEYSTVVLEGVGLPHNQDSKTNQEMGKALTEMVEGKYVTLEYDTPGQPSGTSSGAILAYVFIEGKMVNEELIRQGLGRFGGQWGGKRYQDRLRQAEKEAKDARRGMWANYEEKPARPEENDYDNDYDNDSDRDYDQGEVNVYEQEYDNDDY